MTSTQTQTRSFIITANSNIINDIVMNNIDNVRSSINESKNNVNNIISFLRPE